MTYEEGKKMLDKLDELLLGLKFISVKREEVNYYRIPITNIETDNLARFVGISTHLKKLIDAEIFHEIVSTKKNGISIARTNFMPFSCRMTKVSGSVELTIIYKHRGYRINFVKNGSIEDNSMPGRVAFNMFRKKCIEYGIDLDKYKVSREVGQELNSQIEKYMIMGLSDLEFGQEHIYHNVYHVDAHSGFAGCLAIAFPELKPVVDYFYYNRKTHPEYKDVLTHCIGYFHSECCDYEYTALAKGAIDTNNKRLRELIVRLKRAGRKPMLTNTDGVFYRNGEVEFKDLFGNGPGEFHTDIICKDFRAKKRGCYEYISDKGEYKPVVRAYTNLDSLYKMKYGWEDRTNWKWGDIFKIDKIMNKFSIDWDTWDITVEDIDD